MAVVIVVSFLLCLSAVGPSCDIMHMAQTGAILMRFCQLKINVDHVVPVICLHVFMLYFVLSLALFGVQFDIYFQYLLAIVFSTISGMVENKLLDLIEHGSQIISRSSPFSLFVRSCSAASALRGCLFSFSIHFDTCGTLAAPFPMFFF